MQTNLYNAAKAVDAVFASGMTTTRLAAPIEIIVAGATHTGKSHISAIIEKALTDAGYTDVVMVDSEETPELREQMANLSMSNSFPDSETVSLLSKTVSLRQVNMHFKPKES